MHFIFKSISENYRNLDLSLTMCIPFLNEAILGSFRLFEVKQVNLSADWLSLRKREHEKGKWRENEVSCSLWKALSQRRNLISFVEPFKLLTGKQGASL